MLIWEITTSQIRLVAAQMVEMSGGAIVIRTQATLLQDHMIILNDVAGHAVKVVLAFQPSLAKAISFYLPAFS